MFGLNNLLQKAQTAFIYKYSPEAQPNQSWVIFSCQRKFLSAAIKAKCISKHSTAKRASKISTHYTHAYHLHYIFTNISL